jgi:hypothetical protein
MRNEDIPAYCFLTGQFLLLFDMKKNEPHYSQVHRDFLNSIETDPPLSDFVYLNPASIIMLCYGLLVFPVEFWDSFFKDQLSIKRLSNSVVASSLRMGLTLISFIDLFTTINPDKGHLSESDFLRKIRNSIAHSHIKVDMQKNLFSFWNVTKAGNIDFEIMVSTEKLGIFLTGLGRYFGNYQK